MLWRKLSFIMAFLTIRCPIWNIIAYNWCRHMITIYDFCERRKKRLRTSIFWIAFVIIVRFQRKDFGIFVGFQQKRNVILITAVSLKSRQIRFMAECIRLTQQHLLGFADAIITGRSKTLTFFATKYWAENINISSLGQCATLFIYACTRDLIFKYLSLA